ncbi:GNAT family N-acetyltransferase [Floricoccus penangensis]|uniref:GNAT family N-acetyltransferase n=1 Tax=Floricoccus penangensis TaxID=1859475 RepID=UPI00203D9C3C|nr:GNAT family N-acetyltransferase [Floricoccus penangensis]URZ86564.1 GNAT family N-acetyltransferase [Floricoccus penangensis]
MEKIQIIKFDRKYQDNMINFILDIQQNEFGVAITLDDQPDLLDIIHHYEDKGGIFLLALDTENDTIIGTIALVKLDENKSALKKVFVDPKYRGEYRVGQKLLDAIVNFARETDIEKIYLGSTAMMTRAHNFYKKNGFVREDFSVFPYDFPIVEVDSVFMVKDL